MNTVRAQKIESTSCQSKCLLSAKGLCVTFADGTRALKNLDLEISSKEHVCIMGPSGGGKTTLLSCIAGRLKPSEGSVDCNAKVATIHQDLRLVEEASALDNILHGAMGRYSFLSTVFSFPKEESIRAKKLLCRVGLCKKIHTKVKRLSGGEKQRVAIARALMQNPEVLLADEPVAALDAENAHSIMNLLTSLARERKLTIISVLHDYLMAKRYSDHIVRIVDGQIVYQQTADDDLSLGKLEPILDSEEKPDVDRQLYQLPKKKLSLKLIPISLIALAVYAWSISGLEVSSRELDGVFSSLLLFVKQLFPTSFADVLKIPWGTLFDALLETIQMAVIGTTLGILISWPLAAFAANNIGTKGVKGFVRFLLNAIRTVPSLIWALLFVAAVGLGTFAGILALTAYSVGYLSKFFYEAFEGVNPGPPDALREIGASGLQRFLHAIWPAAKPAILSSSIFMLEYNVRAASVLGVVDAGGIGYYIKQYLDLRVFPVVMASLLMILAVVVVFDAVSSRIRERLLDKR